MRLVALLEPFSVFDLLLQTKPQFSTKASQQCQENKLLRNSLKGNHEGYINNRYESLLIAFAKAPVCLLLISSLQALILHIFGKLLAIHLPGLFSCIDY
jgi:hypothetical protein